MRGLSFVFGDDAYASRDPLISESAAFGKRANPSWKNGPPELMRRVSA